MTGAEHYAEAERLIEVVNATPAEQLVQAVDVAAAAMAKANIHATLALASAIERGTRYATGMDTGGYGSPDPDPRWAAR